jgi:hypothetical protein
LLSIFAGFAFFLAILSLVRMRYQHRLRGAMIGLRQVFISLYDSGGLQDVKQL